MTEIFIVFLFKATDMASHIPQTLSIQSVSLGQNLIILAIIFISLGKSLFWFKLDFKFFGFKSRFAILFKILILESVKHTGLGMAATVVNRLRSMNNTKKKLHNFTILVRQSQHRKQ